MWRGSSLKEVGEDREGVVVVELQLGGRGVGGERFKIEERGGWEVGGGRVGIIKLNLFSLRLFISQYTRHRGVCG